MTARTAITVNSVSKDFGDVRAVDDLSFDVPYGAVTGFVGGNGSGKTTTMRMMLGLIAPTSGQVLVDGVPYAELAEPRRVVGAVLDRIGAHPGHTARQHLEIVAAGAGLPEDRVDVCLTEVGLSDAADRRLNTYSMGMTQRCALAAAMLGSPPIMLLDEPANGLDPAGIRWLRSTMGAWADDGRVVFVSTHQLAELAVIVDHLVVIHEGTLLHAGSIKNLAASTGQPDTAPLEEVVFELIAAADANHASRRSVAT